MGKAELLVEASQVLEDGGNVSVSPQNFRNIVAGLLEIIHETKATQYVAITNSEAACITGLCETVNDWARKKGFWSEPRNKGELIALMHSELSECLEALRKPNLMDNHVPELTGEAAELADTVIRIFDYCGAGGIDLGRAVQLKHEFNITREHKHGKLF